MARAAPLLPSLWLPRSPTQPRPSPPLARRLGRPAAAGTRRATQARAGGGGGDGEAWVVVGGQGAGAPAADAGAGSCLLC